jgi:hypothetical protein
LAPVEKFSFLVDVLGNIEKTTSTFMLSAQKNHFRKLALSCGRGRPAGLGHGGRHSCLQWVSSFGSRAQTHPGRQQG